MMNETVTEISHPKKPYLVQRIELAEEVDFRKDFPLGAIPTPNDYFKPLVDAK